MDTRLFAFLAPAAVLAMSACAVGDFPSPESSPDDHNIAISVSDLSASDTEYMDFKVYRCGETTPAAQRTRAYEPLRLPGGISSVSERPYDGQSAHIFADQYFLLDAGCYDVEITPLAADYGPSAECGPATRPEVIVHDGETTEVLLVSQCIGAARGALDVVGSLNRPPLIENLTFDPSKFVACPQEVTVCLQASDPDGDPMVVDWSILGGPSPVTEPVISTPTDTNGFIEQCMTFEPGAGVWEIEAIAYDQAYHHGEKITFSELFALTGRLDSSEDVIRFPLYGGGTECAGCDCETAVSDLFALTGRLDSSEDVIRFPLYGGGTECAGCDCETAVSNLSYTIDRDGQQVTVSSLSQILPGDLVTPNFDIAPGCGPIELSFASYTASGPTFASSLPQTTYEWSSSYFADGSQSLAPVAIPACYYQADMVCGAVLWGDEINRGARYADRKLDWKNGGDTSCNADAGCTRTRGYWTQHSEFAFAPGLKIDWPAPRDELDQLCGESWLDVIDASKRPQTRYYQLAAQWIAATLNDANHADVAVVSSELAAAEAMLNANCATRSISAADDTVAEQLKNALDAYNNGVTGPGHCE